MGVSSTIVTPIFFFSFFESAQVESENDFLLKLDYNGQDGWNASSIQVLTVHSQVIVTNVNDLYNHCTYSNEMIVGCSCYPEIRSLNA